MTYFTLFYQALENEKIDCKTNQLLPLQFYAKNYHEFYHQLKSYAEKNKINQFVLVTDGLSKKSALENETDITKLFLQNSNLKCEHINLSQICNVEPTEIHASEFYLQKLIEEISTKNNSCGFIALGSGTITDLLKHALFLLNKHESHFLSIPTATTVTAFTSSFSVVDISGAKKTRFSRHINATFWLEPVLKVAPISLTKAGFGDLLARFVAYGDWYLGSKLSMFDNYNEIALRLMEPFTSFLKCEIEQADNAENYLLNNMVILAETLAMAGISMSLCKQTTPLSGYEHVISHALDFLRLSSNKPLVLHGEQIALSTISSATSYEWIFKQENFIEKNFRYLSEKDVVSVIEKLLKKAPFMNHVEKDIDTMSHLFLKDYLEKNERWLKIKNKFIKFSSDWPEIKKRLKQLVISPEELERIVNKISLPLSPESTNPITTAIEYRWALRFAPFIRSRFCLADFIFWIGEDPCAIAAM